MVLTSDRDHGSRNTRIRKSIDGYAAAAFSSTRKRTSFPSATSKSTEPNTLESASYSHSGSSIGDSPSPSITKPTKNTTSIMSSFFSRFGSRNKSKLTLVTDVVESPPTKQHRYSRHSSMPSTPSPKNRTSSIPIVDPLPPPNAFRTIEQFPLCVAYVQAIKTSLLPACTLSSEKILRQEADRGSKRGRATHRHHVSTKSADLDWTKKLFVLVPGILLQYSGDGMDDRLPEKVLQLTANSLAFASDAIPGRPWVLQVYRSAGEDGSGALVTDRRNAFIAKVTFRGGMKNSASALLMVFECADDMDSWMGILRAEAARLGGKKQKPPPKPRKSLELEKDAEDTEKEHAEDEPGKEESENSRFSRRIVINREDSNAKNEWSSSDENASKRASTYRTSTDAERSITSNDQIVLDQLRGSRLSLHSGGDRTRVMTVSASPDTSPERYSAKSGDTSYKRQSLALSTKSQSSAELRPAPAPLGLSAIDKDGKLYWIPRTPSPTTTTATTTTTNNFSLPTYRQTRTVSVPVIPAILPVPSTTEASEAAQQRRPRPVSIQTASPYTQVSPKPSPSSRPLSMFDSPTRNYYTQRTSATPKSSCELISPASDSTPSTISTTPRRVSALPAPPPPAPIMIPARSRSLRRRSMGALDHDLARGAPKHPPPSVPLPKVPSPVVESGSLGVPAAAMGLSQSMPRSSGEHWGAMEERRKRRKSRQSAVVEQVEQVGLGITVDLDSAIRAAEERSSRLRQS
jgi:hypothetical protein